ncbi:hypothetical protein YC2023_050996 [Brassica napus]
MKKRFVSQWKLPKLKPEAATKLTTLDQPAYWSELPLKPAERRSVIPVLSLKQEEEKLQASILASPIKQIEESHKTEPEPTTLCLKLEEEAEVAEAECGHVPDQIKQEEKVPGGSSKALELVLPTVEQGDNFKTWIGSSWREAFNCKLNKVEKSSSLEATCSEESSKMLLRHEEVLQSFVFHPGETREWKLPKLKPEAATKLTTLDQPAYWSELPLKPAERRSVIPVLSLKQEEEKLQASILASPIKQIEESHKTEPEPTTLCLKLEEEAEVAEAECGHVPDQIKQEEKVPGGSSKALELVLPTVEQGDNFKTWIGSSWREAFNCKLNKVEKSSSLEATCSEESSKMLLRHEEVLQSFVFHPGETREWKLPKLKPEAATKLTTLDQPAYWSELPLKPAERRSVIPVLSLKQEEEKLQASILASPIKQIEESHKTEPEPTTLCLKLEEEAEVAEAECGHVPDQIKQEEKVPGGSSKALELVLPTVEQGDNFKSLACELLIRPLDVDRIILERSIQLQTQQSGEIIFLRSHMQ